MKQYIKVIILSVLVCSTFFSIAQQDKKNATTDSQNGGACIQSNMNIINFGVGIGSGRYYNNYRGNGYSYHSNPALSFSFEHITPKKVGPGYLGIGIYAGYQNSNATYNYYWGKNGYHNNYYYKNSWSNFIIAARGAYHLDALNFNKGEIYFGALAGLRFQTYHYQTNNPDPYAENYSVQSGNVFPTFSVFAGGRWFFVKNVALFGEVGYGVSYLTGGLSFKF